MEQVQADAIRRALEYHGGNKARAARALGISIRGIRNWVRRTPELLGFKRSRSGPPKPLLPIGVDPSGALVVFGEGQGAAGADLPPGDEPVSDETKSIGGER